MGTVHDILLLSDNSDWCERWRRELEPDARVKTSLKHSEAEQTYVPELIVTDRLPVSQPLDHLAEPVSRGEIALVGIGTDGPGDVLLPADCSGRELRLACQLTGEITRLRRQLAEQVRSRRALRKMAYRDPLTGLGNRRKWDEEVKNRMAALRAAEASSAESLGIVLVDVDLFKRLNDQLGHAVGDTTLQRIAQKLRANLSEQHVAARLGGDEFGILLSGLLPTDLPEVVERIRQSLEYSLEDAAHLSPVTTSAGVVGVRASDCQAARPLDALKAASRALRTAKQQGRARTVAHSLGST
ncbi:MAG: GGDEF domain-containing protein [Planctomycetota bacterium]